MWEADYDFSKDQKWCCDSWCYVNPATCTQQIANQYGFTVNPSWLDIEGLWYSYGVCESDQSFPQDPKGSPYDHTNHAVTLTSTAAYTESTCPYKVQPTGCECATTTRWAMMKSFCTARTMGGGAPPGRTGS